MRVVRGNYALRVQKAKPKPKKTARLFGLPKGEVTRRLAGVNCSG